MQYYHNYLSIKLQIFLISLRDLMSLALYGLTKLLLNHTTVALLRQVKRKRKQKKKMYSTMRFNLTTQSTILTDFLYFIIDKLKIEPTTLSLFINIVYELTHIYFI